MKKTIAMIASAFIITTLTTATAGTNLENQTKAMIQGDLLSSSLGYEISTGQARKDGTEASSQGIEAYDYFYNTLSNIDTKSAPQISISKMMDFTETNESFKAPNSEELNRKYATITGGTYNPQKGKNRPNMVRTAVEMVGLDPDAIANISKTQARVGTVLGATVATALTNPLVEKVVRF